MATLLLAAAGFLAAGGAAPASAQGWFGNFFGGGGFGPRPRQGAPAYPGYGGGSPAGGYGDGPPGVRTPADDYAPPRRRARRAKPAPVDQADKNADKVDAPQKTNATTFVYVLGDSLGQMLANGLDDAMADRADVGIVHDAKGSSGLVVRDFYDWPVVIADLLAGKPDIGKPDSTDPASGKTDTGKAGDAKKPPKIDVGVMMIGTNDRQSIREDGKVLAQGTPEWIAAYTKRVMAVDEAFRAHHVPLIWVGVPITKSDTFADSMAAFNDIYREAAAKTGAVYVDTWDAFSDDDGEFAFNGPDVTGQTTRLRANDGIHFTQAGARKLAHFVETHVRRALDGKTPMPQLPVGDAPASGGQVSGGRAPGEQAKAAAKPDAGPIRNLNETPKTSNGELATLAPAKGAAPPRDPLVATTMVRGEAVPIPAGRADDFRWPKNGQVEP